MKRTIGAFIVLSFLMMSMVGVYSIAEEENAEFEIKALSTDELIHLRIDIEEELNNRISDGNASIYPGNYSVGKDILAGTYLLTGTKTDLHDYSIVKWYDENKKIIDSATLKEGEVLNLTLEDGMSLVIDNTPCLIQEAPKMPFAPN